MEYKGYWVIRNTIYIWVEKVKTVGSVMYNIWHAINSHKN